MAAASAECLRDELQRLAGRSDGVGDFSRGAARALRRAVPFDGFCLITTDPATSLPTGEVVENALPPEATGRMTAIEVGGEDYNSFRSLSASAEPAASLSGATGGELDRSLRHRELRAPHGFGDELRAALVVDAAVWGGLTLLRSCERDRFSAADVALVSSLAAAVGEGLREAILPAAPSPAPRPVDGGVLLLAPDDSISRSDAAAERWLAELRAGSERLPQAVVGVANRARRAPAGREAGAPQVRVRARSGVWLVVRASQLGAGPGAQTAVVIEPAGPGELASLVADARGLTAAERGVTQLVAAGLPTTAIAARLQISPWTVQDHLKSAFEKLGVSSRGELVARLFFSHDAPRLHG